MWRTASQQAWETDRIDYTGTYKVSARIAGGIAEVEPRDGNRTELEPNRTRSHEEPEPNKNPAVWVLKF